MKAMQAGRQGELGEADEPPRQLDPFPGRAPDCPRASVGSGRRGRVQVMGWRRPAVCAWDGEVMVKACSIIKTREARFHFRAPKRVPVTGRGGAGRLRQRCRCGH